MPLNDSYLNINHTSLVVICSSESGSVACVIDFFTGLGGGYFLNTKPVPSPALDFPVSRKKLDLTIFLFFTLSIGSFAEVGLLLVDPEARNI